MDATNEKTGENTPDTTGNPPIALESPASATPAETVTADQLAGPLADSMPVPTATESQTEIPAVNEASPLPPRPVPVIRDKSGKLFDPAKHAVDQQGQPRFNTNGFFISNRIGNPGKKRSAENTTQANAENGQSVSPPPTGDIPTNENGSVLPDSGNAGTSAAFNSPTGGPDQYDASADLFLQVGYGLASSFLGDGIRPEFKVERRTQQTAAGEVVEEVVKFTAEGRQEHESLRLPLAAVLREKQTTGLTPTQMFLASLAAFVAKKAAKPTVRERFTLLALKVKNWFSKSKI